MTHTQEESLVFAGFGGQGIMFAGQLLAYAAMDAGYRVTWIPSYGPEMRGGTANCFVVISARPIGSPLVRHPRCAVVFNIPSFTKFEPVVAPGGLLVSNRSLVLEASQRTDITALGVPATDMASRLGALQLTNMVMLGVVLTARPLLTLDIAALKTALVNHLPARRQHLLEANYQALEAGAEYALDHLPLVTGAQPT